MMFASKEPAARRCAIGPYPCPSGNGWHVGHSAYKNFKTRER